MSKRMGTLCALALTLWGTAHAQASWNLEQCIEHALQNNIQIQKNRISEEKGDVTLWKNQGALFPSLSFSTTQSMGYRPFETGTNIVQNGQVTNTSNKVTYQGSYGLNARWTIWDGGKNLKNVEYQKLQNDAAKLTTEQSELTIQEQIAQLYVQILYSLEAKKASQAALSTSQKNEERGQEFVKAGKMSKADLAQLTAQRAQDQYSVVQAESNVSEYTRQLRQLLQLTDGEAFEVVADEIDDQTVLQQIPALQNVYNSALATRPEIKNAQLGIQASALDIKMAKAGKLPTIGLSAGLTTNTTSMSNNAWRTQIKNNFNIGAGFTVSIPLLDQRKTKTAINKAQLQRINYELELKDKQTQLYSTIENYWIQASTNQSMFKAAKVSTESAVTSYELLSEQFRLGLKNIVELLTGRDNMLKAQQSELQSKYLTMLNLNMLNFYQNGRL